MGMFLFLFEQTLFFEAEKGVLGDDDMIYQFDSENVAAVF